MVSTFSSLSLLGLSGEIIEIEVNVHRGLPSFSIVGMTDTAIQEAKERVRSAIKNNGFEFPRAKVAVNLAPADLRKHGPRFDIPIALGILQSTKQIPNNINFKKTILVGELAFSGDLRPVTGILPTTSEAIKHGFDRIFVPAQNAKEANLIPNIEVYPVETLQQLIDHINGNNPIRPLEKIEFKALIQTRKHDDDMKHVKGQEYAKRALEIAAAGGHNILMLCL